MVAILEKALLGAGECEAVFVGVLAGDAVRLGGASPVFSALGFVLAKGNPRFAGFLVCVVLCFSQF